MKKMILFLSIVLVMFLASGAWADSSAEAGAKAKSDATAIQDDHSSTIVNEIQKRPLVNPYVQPQFALTPYNGAQKGKWFLYWSPVDSELSMESIKLMKKRYTFPEIVTFKWLKRHVRVSVREKPLPANNNPIKLMNWDPFSRGFHPGDRKIGEVVFKNKYSYGPWPFDGFIGLVADEAKDATMTERIFVFVRLNEKGVAKASALAGTIMAAEALRRGMSADNASLGGAITPMIGTTTFEIEEVEEIRVLCMNDGPIEPPSLPEKVEKPEPKPEAKAAPKQEVEIKLIVVPGPTEIKVPVESKVAPIPVPSPAPEKKCELPEFTIFFDFDKYDIKEKYLPKIKELAVYLAANEKCAIQVEGHCSQPGSYEYNAALGRKRAKVVYDALLASGAPAKRVFQFVSVSEDRLASGKNAEDQRAIVRIVGPASGK